MEEKRITLDQKDLRAVLCRAKGYLFGGASKLTPDEQDSFLTGLAADFCAIPKADSTFATILKTEEGQKSLWDAFRVICQMGLAIGKTCYVMPSWTNTGIAIVSITVAGYMHLLCGPGKPLKGLRATLVHEKDTCSINTGDGTFNHFPSFDDDPGKQLGGIVQLTFQDDFKTVFFMRIADVNKRKEFALSKLRKIKDPAKAKYLIETSPYTLWPDEMTMKCIISKAIKPYAHAFWGGTALGDYERQLEIINEETSGGEEREQHTAGTKEEVTF